MNHLFWIKLSVMKCHLKKFRFLKSFIVALNKEWKNTFTEPSAIIYTNFACSRVLLIIMVAMYWLVVDGQEDDERCGQA